MEYKLNSKDQEDLGEMERYKNECMRLEKIVANMKEELRNKRPMSSDGADWENEKMELEVKLHKANSRIEALQDEMTYNAKNYGKEMAQLKLIIAVNMNNKFRKNKPSWIHLLQICDINNESVLKVKN